MGKGKGGKGLSKDVQPGVIVLLFGFLGAILAWIEGYLDANGYVINAYTTGDISLQALQIVTVIFALLVGTVVAVWTS